MYGFSSTRTAGCSPGCERRKCCKVAAFNEVRAYHNEIICKKKRVDSATSRISGYCTLHSSLVHCHLRGTVVSPATCKSMSLSAEFWFPFDGISCKQQLSMLGKCFMFIRDCNIQCWCDVHLRGNTTHSCSRQMAWRKQGLGRASSLSTKEQNLIVSQQGPQTKRCCCQDAGIDWVQQEQLSSLGNFP